MVVLSPFRSEAALQYADVILPVTPFTETAGTFVNCRRPAAKLQRRRPCAGRFASGLEGAARAGQPARGAWFRLRDRRKRA
ncbi:molybdopterin-dependent oxidoreductase [Cupriavidus basilensis]